MNPPSLGPWNLYLSFPICYLSNLVLQTDSLVLTLHPNIHTTTTFIMNRVSFPAPWFFAWLCDLLFGRKGHDTSPDTMLLMLQFTLLYHHCDKNLPWTACWPQENKRQWAEVPQPIHRPSTKHRAALSHLSLRSLSAKPGLNQLKPRWCADM